MKKSSIYTSILASALSISVSAQHKNIAFEHVTFKELKEKAAKANKLIFVDAYTTWCGPCKQMAKTIFTNDTVADYYNSNFINAKIDMEKGEGIELAKQYNVNCYPNLLFIDGQGNVVHRVAGSMSASEFIAFGKQAQQPEGTYAYYAKNYEAQKNNPEFLTNYIQLQSNTCIEPTEAVAQYFSLQKQEDLTNQQNWEMIQNYTNDMNSREFGYLLANKKKFDDLYTPKKVDGKINDVHYNSLIKIIYNKTFDETQYQKTKETIASRNIGNSNKVIFEADIALAKKNKDVSTFTKLAVNNVDVFYKEDAQVLNSMAWDFYEQVSDKEALLKAESWAKLSTELDPNYANMDTYASLLYKTGKKTLAMETANKAIDLAKKDGMTADDYKATSDLLQQIKAMK